MARIPRTVAKLLDPDGIQLELARLYNKAKKKDADSKAIDVQQRILRLLFDVAREREKRAEAETLATALREDEDRTNPVADPWPSN